MSFKKLLSTPTLLAIFAIGLVLLFVRSLSKSKATNQSLEGDQAVIAGLQTSKYSGIAKYVQKLARFETGRYTSGLYKNDHNMFGMGVAKVRPFVREGINQSGEAGRPTSIYKDDLQSVQDWILWANYTNFPSVIASDEQFVKALADRKYFTADYQKYLSGFKSM